MPTIYIREGVGLPERKQNDFYPTPLHVARAGLDLIPVEPNTVLDPGAGKGVWGEAAFLKWDANPKITGLDIDPEIPEAAQDYYYHFMPDTDFTTMPVRGDYHLVMGNPPYRYAEEFIRKALDYSSEYVLFLLQLKLLGGDKRMNGLWRQFPPKKVQIIGRVSFSGNGKTNADEYAFYLWQMNTPKTPPVIEWRVLPRKMSAIAEKE